MSSYRSRNLVQMCLESDKQNRHVEPLQKQIAEPKQDLTTPSSSITPIPAQFEMCLESEYLEQDGHVEPLQNERSVPGQELTTPSSSITLIPAQFEFIYHNTQTQADFQEVFALTMQQSVEELAEMSNVDGQTLTCTKTTTQLNNLETSADMSLAIDSTLIEPSELGFDDEPLRSTSFVPAEDNIDMSAQEDSDYVPLQEANNSSSDSSLSDEENTVRVMPTNRNSEEAEPFYGDMSEGRKRRKKADPNQWKKNLNKRLRMEGKPYLGYEAPKGHKIQHNKSRPARSMGRTCSSDFCKNSAVRRCDIFTEDNRKYIFDNFWKTMDWSQRKIYVGNNVTVVGKKRQTTSGPSRRGGTLKYFLPLTKEDKTTEKISVCRQMFLNTLCLGTFTVQTWAKKSRAGMLPSQENEYRSRNIRSREGRSAQLITINDFFDSLPKLPSHYNRKDTTKLFIEPVIRNKSQLYLIYEKFCIDKNCNPFSRRKFDDVFSDKNIAIHTLKKDMCDTCLIYQNGNLSEDVYQQHILRKNKAREEKERDKKDASERKCLVLNVDLQAVKVCPFLTASAVYYKTKLALHNYTIYNVATHHASSYWFTETEADLSSSTFASMLINYLEQNCLQENIPIIIYSDGCAAQNRNNILANALLNFSMRHNVKVYQKYLEVGHTQMEGDSVHSCIERKLKNRIINLPSDYVTATKEARIKPFPYETVMLQYNFFLNYTDPGTWRYSSIRPGRKAGDHKVTDIKNIFYQPDGIIRVKLDYDSEFIDLPQRPKRIAIVEQYKQLHQKQLPITDLKYRHLQELKSLLPEDCQQFYDSLPHQNN